MYDNIDNTMLFFLRNMKVTNFQKGFAQNVAIPFRVFYIRRTAVLQHLSSYVNSSNVRGEELTI